VKFGPNAQSGGGLEWLRRGVGIVKVVFGGGVGWGVGEGQRRDEGVGGGGGGGGEPGGGGAGVVNLKRCVRKRSQVRGVTLCLPPERKRKDETWGKKPNTRTAEGQKWGRGEGVRKDKQHKENMC